MPCNLVQYELPFTYGLRNWTISWELSCSWSILWKKALSVLLFQWYWFNNVFIFQLACLLQLKKAFPKKNLPPAPPKGLLRMKTRALLEEVFNVFLNHICISSTVIYGPVGHIFLKYPLYVSLIIARSVA